MDAREDGPGAAGAWDDGGEHDGEDHPAGRLEPAERWMSGRRATVLAGLMVAAVAIGDLGGISGTLPSGLRL